MLKQDPIIGFKFTTQFQLPCQRGVFYSNLVINIPYVTQNTTLNFIANHSIYIDFQCVGRTISKE